MKAGRVERVFFESTVLRDNPLGDPWVREVPVYLPPGYDESGERYPVIVALTGFTGRGVMLLNRPSFAPGLDQRLDDLLARQAMAPAIVVMPDCYTRYGGSQYLDSSATGRYETHVVAELVPYVDAHYRTRAAPATRAVMGKSSGGYGALVLGLRHPDLFGVVASHSGDCAFEYCYLPDFPAAMMQLEKHGGVAGFLAAFDRLPKKPPEMLLALNILAMAAAYSPNPAAAPHGFDLPFDPATGALRPEVWERWLAWDPLRLLERHHHALRRLRLFLDCGTRDEFRLYAGARMIAARLRQLGVPHTHEEFDDTHMEITYRYERSLRFISAAFHDPAVAPSPAP